MPRPPYFLATLTTSRRFASVKRDFRPASRQLRITPPAGHARLAGVVHRNGVRFIRPGASRFQHDLQLSRQQLPLDRTDPELLFQRIRRQVEPCASRLDRRLRQVGDWQDLFDHFTHVGWFCLGMRVDPECPHHRVPGPERVVYRHANIGGRGFDGAGRRQLVNELCQVFAALHRLGQLNLSRRVEKRNPPDFPQVHPHGIIETDRGEIALGDRRCRNFARHSRVEVIILKLFAGQIEVAWFRHVLVVVGRIDHQRAEIRKARNERVNVRAEGNCLTRWLCLQQVEFVVDDAPDSIFGQARVLP